MVRPRAVLLLIASSLVPAAACSDRPAAESTSARDSAGIRIVDGARDRARGSGLALQPIAFSDLRASRRNPAARAEFSRISAVDGDSSGLLYVLDGIEGVVTVLEAGTGRVIRTFGRRGAGPGEFRAAADLQVRADGSILVGERVPPRVHRFTREGRHLETLRPALRTLPGNGEPAPAGVSALAGWSAAPGGGLIARILTLGADPTRPASNRLLRVGANGSVGSVLLEWREEGTLAAPPPIFSPRWWWAADPTGRVYYSSGSDYEVRVLGPDGRIERIIRRPAPHRPVPRAAGDRAIEAFRQSMIEGGAPADVVQTVVGKLEVASHLPSIHGLWIDPDRRELWVGIPEVLEDLGELRAGAYHLLDLDGRFLGRVPSPPGFRLHAVRDRQLLGVETDELDVPHPRVYRLVSSGRQGPPEP
jgi:hypothetical protein